MKQTRKMVVAAAAAVGAVAGGAVALANVPVGAAPIPSAQVVVASSTASPADLAEAEERARLEAEIATSQRALDRLASASPTAAAAVASGKTVDVQGVAGQDVSTNGGGSTGDGASTPAPEPSSDTWTGASGNEPGSGYDEDDDEYESGGGYSDDDHDEYDDEGHDDDDDEGEGDDD